ncbi:hypothetical protein IJD44_01690 [bacterium]|nr:hypothetical protein [bacterium]
MRKVFFVIFLLLFFAPAYGKGSEKLPVKSQDFGDFNRYMQTLEINDEVTNVEQVIEPIIKIEDNFEDEVMLDVVQRYDEHAVVLNMDDDADSAMDDFNSSRVFSLSVNETKYVIENSIKNENMIWDGSKSFSSAFLTNSRHMAPIPSVINSQSITATVSPSLSASLGQTFLYNSTGHSLLFIRTNESTYNTGSVISYKADGLNLSVGSFSSSFNHQASGGAILSTDALKLPNNAGSFVFGGAYFANEAQEQDKMTGGGFVEYSFKRLKLNAQIGQSKYTNSPQQFTSLYLVPEFRISDSIYLKTRFIRNVSQETMQDELVLSYKPKNNKRNFEFEINATNHYTHNSQIKQRIKFSTSFKI